LRLLSLFVALVLALAFALTDNGRQQEGGGRLLWSFRLSPLLLVCLVDDNACVVGAVGADGTVVIEVQAVVVGWFG
jgi:hypothetical protein